LIKEMEMKHLFLLAAFAAIWAADCEAANTERAGQ